MADISHLHAEYNTSLCIFPEEALLVQQSKVFIPRDASGFEVISDDGNWNLVVSGNDNGTSNARLEI
jgi:hypothetical protein